MYQQRFRVRVRSATENLFLNAKGEKVPWKKAAQLTNYSAALALASKFGFYVGCFSGTAAIHTINPYPGETSVKAGATPRFTLPAKKVAA